MGRRLSGLRTRLIGLTLIAILPAMGTALYVAWEARRLVTEHVQSEALTLARLAAAEQDDVFERAASLLESFAHFPVTRPGHGQECNALFARLLPDYGGYLNLGAADARGDVFCSAHPVRAPVNFADRAWFVRAVNTRAFAVGELTIGRITGKPIVGVGYPVLDPRGAVVSVVWAALDLNWLGRFVHESQAPPGSNLTVVDSAGTVIARVPDAERWAGTSAADVPIVQTMRARGQGVALTTGLNGERRLFGFTRFGRHADAYVAVGLPVDTAFAAVDRVTRRHLAILTAAALLAIAGTWVGADLFVLRRVRALVAATSRLAAGDLAARSRATGPGELDELGRAFDDMAGALERRQTRLQTLEELTRLISGSLDLTELLTAIAHAAAQLMDSPAAIFWLVDERARALSFGAFSDPAFADAFDVSSRGYDGVGVAWVAEHRKPLDVPDMFVASGLTRRQAWARHHGLSSLYAVPVMSGDAVVAVLALHGRHPFRFTTGEHALLASFVAQAAIAIRNAQLFRATAAAEAQYRLLFDRNLAGIFRSRHDGHIVECNDALARLLGYASRADVLGQRATAFYMTPVDRERLLERLRGGQTLTNVEVECRRRDGSPVPALLNISEVTGEDGATYLEGIVLDISDRKRSEAAERQAEALRSVTQLANATAHEINNPLAVITMNLELLARKVPDEAAIRHVERALTACRRITEMIVHMRRITRLEVRDEWAGVAPILDITKSAAPGEPPAKPGG